MSVTNSVMDSQEPQESPAVPDNRRYLISEQLSEVLTTSGAEKGVAYSWKHIIMMLIKYLMRRKPSLLDPNNGNRVVCAGDPIASVFGVSAFTKQETKLLVRQHVTLVEEEPAVAAKREAEDGEDPEAKRARLDGAGPSTADPADVQTPPQVPGNTATDQHQATEPTPAGSNGPEEAAADDHREETSTDDLSGDDDEYEEDLRNTYSREMEPVDMSDDDCSSTSGESDVEPVVEPMVESCELSVEDRGEIADQEDSDTDAGAASPQDWLCRQCDSLVSSDTTTCTRCFTSRLPEVVPERRRKRRTRHQRRLLAAERAERVRPAAGSGGSQDSVGSPESEPVESADCVICCENKSNAAIVHGRTGCKVACYKCARTLWKRQDRCPSCRRSIRGIITLKY